MQRAGKSVLMIAFHFPPFGGGSGVLRTLKFSRYLRSFGWEPMVLSADPCAYPQVSPEELAEVLEDLVVKRASALDTARHLAFRGAYFGWMALPDRWVSWAICAIPAGLQLIRAHQPRVIWSTYPIATAHLIGLALHRLSGLPWVVDLRDSMTEEHYPADPIVRRIFRWIERQIVRRAARIVFTAESARTMYLQRYPGLNPSRCLVISNGYDEEDFSHITSDQLTRKQEKRLLRLVHSGLIYPKERDPKPFFRAIARLKEANMVNSQSLRVDLRASGSESYYQTLLREYGVEDIVCLLPSLPYHKGLEDCADADALLLLQAASCDHQIPAKLYEYLRMQKPILALTSHGGDSASVMKVTGGATIISLSDEEAIYRGLPGFLDSVKRRTHPVPDRVVVERYSRKYQAGQLAECLSQVGQ